VDEKGGQGGAVAEAPVPLAHQAVVGGLVEERRKLASVA
jgi:hypothetical protein